MLACLQVSTCTHKCNLKQGRFGHIQVLPFSTYISLQMRNDPLNNSLMIPNLQLSVIIFILMYKMDLY